MKVLAERRGRESSSLLYLQHRQLSPKNCASFIGSIIFSLDFGLQRVGMRANGGELVFNVDKLMGVRGLIFWGENRPYTPDSVSLVGLYALF